MPIFSNSPSGFRSSDDKETWRRIYHEAAHAVVAITLGTTVRSVDIFGGGGRVDADQPDKGSRAENAFHRMVIKIASFPGEQCLPDGRTREQWRQGAGGGHIGDIKVGWGDWPEFCSATRDYCRAKGFDVPSIEDKEEDYQQYFDHAYKLAKQIVDSNRDAIEEIGKRLYDRGKLLIEELQEIMQQYPPQGGTP